MQVRKLIAGLFVGAASLAQVGSARAVDLASFAYNNLNGSYSASSSLFSAVDDNGTDGSVTRLVAPTGTALFSGAIGGFPAAAAFDLDMTISSLTSTSASVLPGDGAITLTDANGDSISGLVEGQWTKTGNSASFSGLLTNVMPANPSTDSMFDGNTGAFSMTFPATPPFTGNIITLAFSNWFTDGLGVPQSFSASTTLAAGAIVPEPATLLLLGIGCLAVVRRRLAA